MIRIACTAVCKRIRAGRVNKAGDSFIGNPTDVTSDFFKAVVDFFGTDGPQKVFVNGVPRYEVEVRAIEPTGSTGEPQ
jgi:hypothetical protein